jgi:indoleamine 2,3-dioxygenase
MFPQGVIYEGVSDQSQVFRGESGANDSIIPLADNLLQITEHMPKNPLTATLREFRHYRPSAQRVYLEALEQRSIDANVADFARTDNEALALYILMVDQVREFRDRHWRFTKSYIIERWVAE